MDKSKNNKGSLSKTINYEEILHLVSASILDHVFYRDLDGKYIDVNKSFLDDINLKKEDVIGKTNYELDIFKELAPIFENSDKEIIKMKTANTFQKSIVFNNELRHIETIKSPCFDKDNNLLGIVGISRDITDRILREEEEDRIKSEFFANLSHELRTPLNLVFSCLQTLDLKMKDNDEVREICESYLSIIKQNSQRSLKLINNFIDSNKLNSGYLELNKKSGDIIYFIENICESVAEFAEKKGIELIFDTNVEECTMEFDMDKVERILLNLLSNSIKYNNPNGEINVSVDFEIDMIKIIVRDNGIGIPKDKIEDIFKRFKHIDNRLRKHSEGSGMGLSLTKALVEIHGGNISVKSEAGIGTEFTVNIPYEEVNDKNYYENNIEEHYYYCNGLVERISIEFSDIYGIHLNDY